MKTIGEILAAARKEKNLSLMTVSRITKIELKYIKALEANDFAHLPPSTFVKGFIRNYAQVVDRSPDELIAVYRRDFAHRAPKAKTTLTTAKSLRFEIKSLWSWSHFLVFLFGAVVFFGYLAFQYRALIIRPPLEVVQPIKQAVVNSPVIVEGKTSADSLVTVNGDTDARPDQSGIFSVSLNLSPGEHLLEIVATNRFGRENTVKIPITVISAQ